MQNQIINLQFNICDLDVQMGNLRDDITTELQEQDKSINSNHAKIKNDMDNRFHNINQLLENKESNIKLELVKYTTLLNGIINYLQPMGNNIRNIMFNIKDSTTEQFNNIPNRLHGIYSKIACNYNTFWDISSKLDKLLVQKSQTHYYINKKNNAKYNNTKSNIKVNNQIIQDKDGNKTQIRNIENELDETIKQNEIKQNVILDQNNIQEEYKDIEEDKIEDDIKQNKMKDIDSIQEESKNIIETNIEKTIKKDKVEDNTEQNNKLSATNNK